MGDSNNGSKLDHGARVAAVSFTVLWTLVTFALIPFIFVLYLNDHVRVVMLRDKGKRKRPEKWRGKFVKTSSEDPLSLVQRVLRRISTFEFEVRRDDHDDDDDDEESESESCTDNSGDWLALGEEVGYFEAGCPLGESSMEST